MGEKTNEQIKEEIRQRKRERKRAKKERQREEKELIARRNRFYEISSGVIMISVRFSLSEAFGTYIIVEKEEDADKKEDILHFKSIEARELLTAAFYPERQLKGKYYNNTYTIYEVTPRKDAARFMKLISPSQVQIRSKGGFQESILNRRYTLISLLLYSPFSQRFELMLATHDRDSDVCFTDISNFRYFVNHHGNPHLNLEFEPIRSSSSLFEHLNEESKLHGYGYNVSNSDNISAFYRQKLLAEVIDLFILSPYQIIKHLEFLIQTRKGPSLSVARSKWREDLLFVYSYIPNPDRFLVVSEKSNRFPPAMI